MAAGQLPLVSKNFPKQKRQFNWSLCLVFLVFFHHDWQPIMHGQLRSYGLLIVVQMKPASAKMQCDIFV